MGNALRWVLLLATALVLIGAGIFLLLAMFRSESSAVHFLLVRSQQVEDFSPIWDGLLDRAAKLEMGCIYDPRDSDLLPVNRAELASRSIFCFWAKEDQKFHLEAASWELEFLVVAHSQTNAIFPTHSKAKSIIVELQTLAAKDFPKAEVSVCIEDCDSAPKLSMSENRGSLLKAGHSTSLRRPDS